jgi:hypothetical protein
LARWVDQHFVVDERERRRVRAVLHQKQRRFFIYCRIRKWISINNYSLIMAPGKARTYRVG